MISITRADGTRTVIENHGDGTGEEITYDGDGNETSRRDVDDLPLPLTAQQSITSALEAMPSEAAAPILAVLNGIAQLTEEEAEAFIARLLAQ